MITNFTVSREKFLIEKLAKFINESNIWIFPFILSIIVSNTLTFTAIVYPAVAANSIYDNHSVVSNIIELTATPTNTPTPTMTPTATTTLRPTPLNPTWPAPSKTPEVTIMP